MASGGNKLVIEDKRAIEGYGMVVLSGTAPISTANNGKGLTKSNPLQIDFAPFAFVSPPSITVSLRGFAPYPNNKPPFLGVFIQPSAATETHFTVWVSNGPNDGEGGIASASICWTAMGRIAGPSDKTPKSIKARKK